MWWCGGGHDGRGLATAALPDQLPSLNLISQWRPHLHPHCLYPQPFPCMLSCWGLFISFLQGAHLEPRYGPLGFARLVASLSITSNLLYVAAALALPALGIGKGAGGSLLGALLGRGLMHSCAAGFSGVLFGLKVGGWVGGSPRCVLGCWGWGSLGGEGACAVSAARPQGEA